MRPPTRTRRRGPSRELPVERGVVRAHPSLRRSREKRWESPRTKRDDRHAPRRELRGGPRRSIEFRRLGQLPEALAARVPERHFYAVDVAFTLLLLLEVVSLIFSLSHSFSDSLGKQFEILSLILLRETFHGFKEFGEPIAWENVREGLLPMASDATGALLVFVLARRLLPRPRTGRSRLRPGRAARLRGDEEGHRAPPVRRPPRHRSRGRAPALTGLPTFSIFAGFYTVLIFSDILIVLVSLRYSTTYAVFFRNSGFTSRPSSSGSPSRPPPLERRPRSSARPSSPSASPWPTTASCHGRGLQRRRARRADPGDGNPPRRRALGPVDRRRRPAMAITWRRDLLGPTRRRTRRAGARRSGAKRGDDPGSSRLGRVPAAALPRPRRPSSPARTPSRGSTGSWRRTAPIRPTAATTPSSGPSSASSAPRP